MADASADLVSVRSLVHDVAETVAFYTMAVGFTLRSSAPGLAKFARGDTVISPGGQHDPYRTGSELAGPGSVGGPL